jgi:hypothetical protein
MLFNWKNKSGHHIYIYIYYVLDEIRSTTKWKTAKVQARVNVCAGKSVGSGLYAF